MYVSHPEHVAESNVPIIAISDHYPVNGSMFNS